MKFKDYVNEEILKEEKIADFIDLGLKASDFNITLQDLPRAESIGALSYLMPEFEKQNITPMVNNSFHIRIKNNNIIIEWTPKGKKTIRIRLKENNSYLNGISKVFKDAYTKYFKNLKKK